MLAGISDQSVSLCALCSLLTSELDFSWLMFAGRPAVMKGRMREWGRKEAKQRKRVKSQTENDRETNTGRRESEHLISVLH